MANRTNELPPVNDAIRHQMAGEFDHTQLETNDFDAAFQITENQEAGSPEKKRVYWKDIIAMEEARERGEVIEEQAVPQTE